MSREQFEKWALSAGWSIGRHFKNEDAYAHSYAQCGWQAWQAATASDESNRCDDLLSALCSVEVMLEERERNIGLDAGEESALNEVRLAIYSNSEIREVLWPQKK